MKSASKKLYNRGQDWSKVTTAKLIELLSNPHTIGVDGKDYGPYHDELQSELWKRQTVQTEKEIKQWDIEFKKQIKAEQSAKGKSA